MSGTIRLGSQTLSFLVLPTDDGPDISFGRALTRSERTAAEAMVWDTVCENPA